MKYEWYHRYWAHSNSARRSGQTGASRLVESMRVQVERAGKALTGVASRLGEEALRQGSEAALGPVEEAVQIYVDTMVKGAREVGRRVRESSQGLDEEAQRLGEEVQREVMREVVKVAVAVLRRGVEVVRIGTEEAGRLGEEAGREVVREVAKQVVRLLRRAAEQGERAAEEVGKLAEEVGREVAMRAEEAFERGVEEGEQAGEVAGAAEEDAEEEAERAVDAGMGEAMRFLERVLLHGLEEVLAAGEQGAEDSTQVRHVWMSICFAAVAFDDVSCRVTLPLRLKGLLD